MPSLYSALLASVLTGSTPSSEISWPAPQAQTLRDSDHRVLEVIARDVQSLLDDADLSADLTWRVKSPASTVAKMQRKGLAFDEVHDRLALRLIVDTEDEVYLLRDAIEARYAVLEGYQKDYIRSPKANGYQSLHTAVRTSGGDVAEFQFRTRAMHDHAENGAAAHWLYKLDQAAVAAVS